MGELASTHKFVREITSYYAYEIWFVSRSLSMRLGQNFTILSMVIHYLLQTVSKRFIEQLTEIFICDLRWWRQQIDFLLYVILYVIK